MDAVGVVIELLVVCEVVLCNTEEIGPEATEVWGLWVPAMVWVPEVVWGPDPILVLCTIEVVWGLEKSLELALKLGAMDWELDTRPDVFTLPERVWGLALILGAMVWELDTRPEEAVFTLPERVWGLALILGAMVWELDTRPVFALPERVWGLATDQGVKTIPRPTVL